MRHGRLNVATWVIVNGSSARASRSRVDLRVRHGSARASEQQHRIQKPRHVSPILREGLHPSDSPTRSLARRFDGALRSRGSLARSLANAVGSLPSPSMITVAAVHERRQVLAGQRRPLRHQLRRRPLEHDPSAVVTGAGAQVDDPVGVRHHRLVVLDDDYRLASVDEPVSRPSNCWRSARCSPVVGSSST